MLAPVKVAITVDDIPEHGDLVAGTSRAQISQGVLDALKRNGVSGAFGFTNGEFVEGAPGEVDIFKDWLVAGYPLGNHTYSHPDLARITSQAFIADIEKQDRLLATLALVSPLIQARHMFRYPFLDEGDTHAKRDAVRKYLFGHGYRIAEVTLDYDDWAWTDAYTRCLKQHDDASIGWLKSHMMEAADRRLAEAESISRRLFNRETPQILLIHVGVFDALTLNDILVHWRSRGVQFVSLEEALTDPIYAIDPNVVYDGGRSFFEQIAMSRQVDLSPLFDSTYTVERLNAVCKAKPPAH